MTEELKGTIARARQAISNKQENELSEDDVWFNSDYGFYFTPLTFRDIEILVDALEGRADD